MTREDILNLWGNFIWMWGQEYFIETNCGNFVWSSPEYRGDNTLRKYSGTYKQYLEESNSDYGRGKGIHYIADYCGENVKVEV